MVGITRSDATVEEIYGQIQADIQAGVIAYTREYVDSLAERIPPGYSLAVIGVGERSLVGFTGATGGVEGGFGYIRGAGTDEELFIGSGAIIELR